MNSSAAQAYAANGPSSRCERLGTSKRSVPEAKLRSHRKGASISQALIHIHASREPPPLQRNRSLVTAAKQCDDWHALGVQLMDRFENHVAAERERTCWLRLVSETQMVTVGRRSDQMRAPTGLAEEVVILGFVEHNSCVPTALSCAGLWSVAIWMRKLLPPTSCTTIRREHRSRA
jgi:hypothetical protein